MIMYCFLEVMAINQDFNKTCEIMTHYIVPFLNNKSEIILSLNNTIVTIKHL